MLKLNNRGFTLIELIVVIAILGMLAGLTVPNVIKIQDKAKTQVDQSNIASLKSAANMAILYEGLPSTKITWDSNTFDANSTGSFNPQEYLEKWPTKPAKSGEDYILTIDTNGKIVINNKGDNNEVGP